MCHIVWLLVCAGAHRRASKHHSKVPLGGVYQVVIAQTAPCSYSFSSVNDAPVTASYQGTAKFTVSPAGYRGTFLDLVIAAFTPKPYGPQEVEVTCTFPQNA